MTVHTLRVAAVKIACEFGEREKNLSRAAAFVENAAANGVKLVLLPELAPGGYMLTEAIWNTAEPFEGTTTGWLKSLSRRLGIYLGTSFLEAEGEDFYNTFALATLRARSPGPGPQESSRFLLGIFLSRPQRPALDRHRTGQNRCRHLLRKRAIRALFRTARCGDRLVPASVLRRLVSGQVPRASKGRRFPQCRPQGGTAETSRLMGIPVVMANKVGRLVTELPAGFPAHDVEFPGFSAVADGDGNLLSQHPSGQEGVAIGDVMLDPSRKVGQQTPRLHGRWNAAMPWWAFIWPLTQYLGERSYRTNPRRKERARSMCQYPAHARSTNGLALSRVTNKMEQAPTSIFPFDIISRGSVFLSKMTKCLDDCFMALRANGWH